VLNRALFCVDSPGDAQVVRRSAHLSGCVQSLLLRITTADQLVTSPGLGQSTPRRRPSLPSLRLPTERLSRSVRPDELRRHHAEISAKTDASRKERSIRTERFHMNFDTDPD